MGYAPLRDNAMTPQLKPHSETTRSDWRPTCRITYTRDTWVKLTQLPSEFAAEDAKLLCQASPDTWIAWVPDHGEAFLDRSHFYV